jgi:hypothetical protein
MFALDLFLGGFAGHAIERLDDARIVHALQAREFLAAQREPEIFRQPLFFQPQIVAREPEPVAAGRVSIGGSPSHGSRASSRRRR